MFYQDILTSRVCNDHPLHCNAAGDCVSEEDAKKIFELGNVEANYLFNLAENADEYIRLSAGALLYDLKEAILTPYHKFALHVAHDLAISSLVAGRRIFSLRWPRLGSEIAFETWVDRKDDHFVRVLCDGEIVDSHKWTPLSQFLMMISDQIPDSETMVEYCANVEVEPPSLFTSQQFRSVHQT
ncbi:histidine phosphatase superfamily [Lactarius vividus]|nr:histidine phosphatase superfamily [Lactarius vividus]